MREFLGFSFLALVSLVAAAHLWDFVKERWLGVTEEPTSGDPVLCDLGGVRCRFIQFFEEDQVLFEMGAMFLPSEREALHKRFKETGVVPPGCSIKRARKLWALIELPTGDVFKTEPDSIKFIRPEAVKDEVV